MKHFAKVFAAFVVAVMLSFTTFGFTGGVVAHADNSKPENAAPLTLNGGWTSGTMTRDKYDWYSVTLPSDGFLTVTAKSDFEYITVKLYNADQTESYDGFNVTGNGANDPGSNNKTYGLDAGTYLIEIFSEWDHDGNYQIKANFQAAGNNDGHNNRSFGSATNLNFNQKINGFISEDNRDDFYKFTVPERENVVVTYSSTMGWLELTVYNADQTEKVITDSASGNGEADPETKTNKKELDAGTYFIRISDAYRTGKYSLSVSVEQAVITMYRAYNPNSGEHFYTSSTKEFNHIVSLGWNNEGTGWIAPAKSNTPVYRLYNANGGEHHYTSNAKEKNALIKAGWKDEGIGWYSDDAKRTPLYRQYNPNAFANNHNYTTSKKENDTLVKLGWRYEGIGWYGVRAK